MTVFMSRAMLGVVRCHRSEKLKAEQWLLIRKEIELDHSWALSDSWHKSQLNLILDLSCRPLDFNELAIEQDVRQK